MTISSNPSQSTQGSSFVPPLAIQSRLASDQAPTPKWAVEVEIQGRSVVCADPRATRAMISLMDAEALIGGAASHFGGPSAFAELMSGLHALMFESATRNNRPWHDLFHFVNDAGHCENGLYALKANYHLAGLKVEDLKHFRSMASKLTGHGEAHLFPEGVLVSNGPLGSSFPQAQGLAMADAFTGKLNRVTVCALSDGAVMEGEAKEALAAIPGFASKGQLAPFVVLISDNATKLSGRIEADAFSMNPTFDSLSQLGWDVIKLEQGNDLKACLEAIDTALTRARANPKKPVAVWAKTVKGKGIKSAEASKTGAHGFPLKKAEELKAFLGEIYAPAPVPSEWVKWTEEVQVREQSVQAAAKQNPIQTAVVKADVPFEKIQLGVAKAMKTARQRGRPVVSVTSDLQGSTGTAEFQKEFPHATFDVGVAEANMISAASGFSQAGYIPFVDTFAQFAVTKGALPLTMANLSLAPVIGVFSHTGFQDAADGASHQALSYCAQLGTIPDVEIYSLSSSTEADHLISEAIEAFALAREQGKVPPSRIFFLGRENFPRCARTAFMGQSTQYRLGQWPVVYAPQDNSQSALAAVIVASGSLVVEACQAASVLASDGKPCVVLHASAINRPDLGTLKPLLDQAQGRIVVVEDHRKVGGTASFLAQELFDRKLNQNVRMTSLGIGNHFGQSAYQAQELYQKHGLDRNAIIEAVKRFSL